jgi:hypothetical protein
MDIRFSIGDDKHLLPTKLAVQDRAERLGGPGELIFTAGAVSGLEIADQRTEVVRDRPQLDRVRLARCAKETLASHQGARPLHPPSPAQLGDDHCDERHNCPEHDEEDEEVLACFLTPSCDETHIVQQHQLSDRGAVDFERPHGEEQWAVDARQHVSRRSGQRGQVGAADLRGEHRGTDDARFRRSTEADGVQTFVHRDRVEKTYDPGLRACANEISQRFPNGVGDETRANVEIPDEPAQHETVNERPHPVGERREREEQWNDESERKPHEPRRLVRASPGSAAYCIPSR